MSDGQTSVLREKQQKRVEAMKKVPKLHDDITDLLCEAVSVNDAVKAVKEYVLGVIEK